MPKNPSRLQHETSKKNLKGHEGPKTIEGKRRSALNGASNSGPKKAKAWAKIIEARHGPSTNTFYSYANCVECTLNCRWPSFSVATSHADLPLACLERVLRERPDRCFYNFEGLCCVGLGSTAGDGIERMAGNCILNVDFLKAFKQMSPKSQECRHRKSVAAIRDEMQLYISEIRRVGFDAVEWTPRKTYVTRVFKAMLQSPQFCVLDGRTQRDWDQALIDICTAQI